ncbi:MAG: chitobiase/beta-hexosaminidase C-terminal domain-containing protein [Pseudobutyrivibrio sp.]|nr:chitobiase/beta-hexosaminidase C-terminal domain-containing protein [Pseudobutyrivibrio sp.]
MKCKNCGEEIESGLVYCPKCGESIQLVPDYDELEEELLYKVVEDKKKAKEEKFAKGVYNNTETSIDIKIKGKRTRELKLSKKIICLGVIIICLVIITGITTYCMRRLSNTYDYNFNKATICEDNGEYNTAITYYNKAVSINSSSMEAIYGLGRMYYMTSDYKDAITQFTLALSLSPENVDIYYYLLECYDALGDKESISALADNTSDPEILSLISEYIILPPEFSMEGGDYTSRIPLYLTSSEGYDIYYTDDGKNPKTQGHLYDGYILVEEGNVTIQAVCCNEKGEYSDVVSETFNIEINKSKVDIPVVTPDGGTFNTETLITIEVPEGCRAYYSWDGSNPAINGILYTQPFPVIPGTSVLTVVLIDNSGNISKSYRANYSYVQ